MKLISFLLLIFITTYAEAQENECDKYIIKQNDLVKVSFCDPNGWCKVENKKSYIKKFLFNKISNHTYQLHENLSDRQKTYYYDLDAKVTNKYDQCMSSKKPTTKKLILDTKEIYEKGLYYYNKKDFKNSYKFFTKIYLQKLMDAKFNFYYANSAYKSGHYEIALASFERVEMIEPNNSRIQLEMARIYYILKMYEDAELRFKDVLQNPTIPKNVRINIELYLAKIANITKKSFTYTTIGLDLFYDSNINFGSLDDEYNIGDNIFPTQDEISASGLQLSGDIVNIYDIGDKNGYLLKNKISLLINKYSNNASYNISYLAYNPSLIYKINNYLVDIGFGFDILGVANNIYMKTISLKPKIDINHTNSIKSSIYFKIIDKFYKEKDLDAYQYEFSYGLQKILSPSSYFAGNVTYLFQNKKNGERIDVDYDEYKLDINYLNQFTPKYSLELYMDIKNRKYKNYSELFISSREDNSGTISSTLNIQLQKDLKLKFKALYNRSHSNQKVFSYQKDTLSMGVVKTF